MEVLFEPYWSATLQEASKICYELISCELLLERMQRPIASAKKLDSNVCSFINVKDNVQLIENTDLLFIFLHMSAGSISKNVQN